MRLTIGVMGSSGGNLSEEAGKKAFRLGEAIANSPSVPVRPQAMTTMSHDRMFVISRPMRPLPV